MIAAWLCFIWLWGVITGIDLILDQAGLPRSGYWHDRISVLMLAAFLTASVTTVAWLIMR